MKGQDLLMALALATERGAAFLSYAALAQHLGLSASEAHAAVARLQAAPLASPGSQRRIHRRSLLEFLLHGFAYVFPAELGAPSLGIPTGPSAPGVREAFDEPELWVWPTPDGDVRGPSIEPIYRSVPVAAANDEDLYQLLALADCLRVGRARERALAEKQLREIFERKREQAAR